MVGPDGIPKLEKASSQGPPEWVWLCSLIDQGFTEKEIHEEFSMGMISRYFTWKSEIADAQRNPPTSGLTHEITRSSHGTMVVKGRH